MRFEKTRRLVLLLFALGAWPALAKPPAPVPAPVPDTTEVDACSRVAVENFQIHTGFAEHAERSVAIASARRDARRQAIQALCSGKSEARCAVLKRHINPWRDPYFNVETHRACAHVGVRNSYIDDDRGEQAALERDIAALAASVLKKTKGTIALAPPLWTQSGCIAGEAGTSVLAALRNALAAAGDVQVVSDPTAPSLRLTLDPGAGAVVLTASLKQPSGEETLLRGFSFPADLFDEGDSRGACRFDSDLGLVDGQRQGPDSRIVTLDVGGAKFCEGDLVRPVLRVNRASVVKVFSVARDGVAHLVWPPPGGAGAVESEVTLDPMMLVPTAGGDEKLLAIAVPPNGSFGTMEGWTGLCRVPTPMGREAIPSVGAAGAATFIVERFDSDACAVRDATAIRAPQVPQIPVCPATFQP